MYARNQQDHDKTLHVLLSRFRQKNLTLNRNKWEFNKSELKFMGYTSSKDGVKSDDSKIKALRDKRFISSNIFLAYLFVHASQW